jgi:hypothetical protein
MRWRLRSMPVGGLGGGPLSVQLDRRTLDVLGEDLFRRARLPLDQACWTAGVDLNQLQIDYASKREELARRGVPTWKQEMVRGEQTVAGLPSWVELSTWCCHRTVAAAMQ